VKEDRVLATVPMVVPDPELFRKIELLPMFPMVVPEPDSCRKTDSLPMFPTVVPPPLWYRKTDFPSMLPVVVWAPPAAPSVRASAKVLAAMKKSRMEVPSWMGPRASAPIDFLCTVCVRSRGRWVFRSPVLRDMFRRFDFAPPLSRPICPIETSFLVLPGT